MRRRDLISVLGGAALVWPVRAGAQSATPVVGLLRSNSRSRHERGRNTHKTERERNGRLHYC
jgi:hypothetical protein